MRPAPSPEPSGEAGFSLVELAVVLLVIAVLIAVFLPTMLAAPDKGSKRRAQSDLRTSMGAALVLAADSDGLFLGPEGDPIDDVALDAEERSIDHVATMPSQEGTVYVRTENEGESITLVTRSTSGPYYCIASRKGGATSFGTHPSLGTEIDSLAEGECLDGEWR